MKNGPILLTILAENYGLWRYWMDVIYYQSKREAKARFLESKDIFDERCKREGVHIKRTVRDVDGMFLLKVRPERMNCAGQYALTDPYGEILP